MLSLCALFLFALFIFIYFFPPAQVVATSRAAKPKIEALSGRAVAKAFGVQDTDKRNRLLLVAGQLASDMEKLSKMSLPPDQQKLLADEENKLQRQRGL